MSRFLRRRLGGLSAAALAVVALAAAHRAITPAAPRCTPGNGGLTLPPGFCAAIVGDHLGAVRHLVVAPNGDLFAATDGRGGGVLALRDTDGDGVADVTKRFGIGAGGTGIALADGHLYFASDARIVRWEWKAGQLEPAGAPESIVDDLPAGGDHTSKSIVLDGHGRLFVNVGSATNSCQERNRERRSPGRNPCAEVETRAGIWRFSADTPHQTRQSGVHYARGLRNTVALALQPGTGALWGASHGRDQLGDNWGFTDKQNANNPAEEFVQIEQGDDFGWPYCYFSDDAKAKVLAPEYGGDGTRADRCADRKAPALAFPGHWGPMDLAFYPGDGFGPAYAGGAFLAFHGSWNRAPLPQAGYRVVFIPFIDGRPAGTWRDFALGRAGGAGIRPSGLAVGPDGSLYVAADQNGTIWRIFPNRSGS